MHHALPNKVGKKARLRKHGAIYLVAIPVRRVGRGPLWSLLPHLPGAGAQSVGLLARPRGGGGWDGKILIL